MGFGKAFLLSLVAFVGLNFIFSILYFVIVVDFDTLMTQIESAPLTIIYYLFGSITGVPSTNMDWAIIQPLFNDNTDLLLIGLGYLVAPIIAGILAGRFAESKLQGFLGWLLTAVVSTVAIIIGVFLSPTLETALNLGAEGIPAYGWIGFDVILIYLLISCIVNIIGYGFFALLASKTEYY
ncbi:hypothetical protein LCGC14_2161350 [marine sediment metagenome]|uniref:Uncharacterized protein n=1 Tax=marine sediment metagenome TaxID=412755 RepID=A0A0F9EF03_9ZZZZ